MCGFVDLFAAHSWFLFLCLESLGKHSVYLFIYRHYYLSVLSLKQCINRVESVSQLLLCCGVLYALYCKYKNEVECRCDTMPKTGDTRTHSLQGRVESMPQSSTTPKNVYRGGCGRLWHTLDSTL